MDALANRRRVAVKLAQLEDVRIEEVVDDLLGAVTSSEAACRLADEDVGVAKDLVWCRPLACLGSERQAGGLDHTALRPGNQRRGKVPPQLLGQMRRADTRAGHALADDVWSVDYNLDHRPSITPRAEVRPRSASRASSHS